ncbi:MAG: hypothetical protein RIS76_4103 [Verrucomicrobiota bacterium]
MIKEPRVDNALLRCCRQDNAAAPLFHPVHEVSGLWVLELGPLDGVSWCDWVTQLQAQFLRDQQPLGRLASGSSEYVLHVTASFSEMFPAVFPASLLQTLGNLGISLELYHGVA